MVQLHPATWHTVPHGVADVLRRAVTDLQAALPQRDTPATLDLAALPDGSVRVRLQTAPATRQEQILEAGLFKRPLDEYAGTLDRLSHLQPDAPARGFQAIDYARRTLHDELAMLLIEELEPLVPLELDAARQLVTVVLLMLRPTSPGLAVLSRVH